MRQLTSTRMAGALLGVTVLLSSGAGCVAPQHVSATRSGDLTYELPLRERPDAAQAAACGTGAATAAGSRLLARHPYVQRVTTSSIAVLWTLDTERPVTVEVTTPEGRPVASIPATVEPSKHFPMQRIAQASGLEAGELYCYRLTAGDDGTPLTLRAGFRTAPEPGAGEPVRFVAFGDSGDGSDEQWLVRNQLDTTPFDLMFVTGDVAYSTGTPRQLERGFFEVYEDLVRHIPSYVVAGNHDYSTDEGAPLREAFALPENGGPNGRERYYSFDWGDVHFVGLDTEIMDEAQAAWLDADLTANDRKWVVVFAHRPPFSSGRHGSNTKVQRLFLPILHKHRVPLLLAGHDHHYERTHVMEGLTTVVTGGGGHGIRDVSTSDFTAFVEPVLHFVKVEIVGDTLTLNAIDASGNVFDTAIIER